MAVIQVPALPNYNTAVLEQALGAAQSQTGSRFNNVWYQFLNLQRQRLVSLLASAPLNVRDDYGAKMNGSDDSGPLQNAINAAITQGGGIVFVPAGKLSFKSVKIPATAPPILLTGESIAATTLELLGTVPSGAGMIDNFAQNFSISDFTIQTTNTAPKQLQYGHGFSTALGANDPMAPSLTNNTSVWSHGVASNFSCNRVRFRHASGYSLLISAMEGVVDYADVVQCFFEDNRASTFGTNPASLIFGSWNGCLFVKSDGRTSGSGVVRHVLVDGCKFARNTGNCCWSHGYGLARLNEDLRVIGNTFEDSGLDSILVGCFTGGSVSDNVIRRNGYVSLTDGTVGVPRWLAGLAPTAIDSSGIVKGINYSGNSVTSPNGAVADLDGHCLSAFTGNVGRVPSPDEPEYSEDSIAITGPNNNGSQSYGCNLGNTSQTPEGATNVNVTGNTFVNLPGGSVRLNASRFCNVEANLITAPTASVNPPISITPTGPGPYQRAYNNRVAHNHCSYSPASGGTPLIFEDETYSHFLPGEVNYCYANSPVIGNGNAVEFVKSPNSGSTVYAPTVWFP